MSLVADIRGAFYENKYVCPCFECRIVNNGLCVILRKMKLKRTHTSWLIQANRSDSGVYILKIPASDSLSGKENSITRKLMLYTFIQFF